MDHISRNRLVPVFICALILALAAPLARADKWTEPTHEELTMTSQPQVPGASAVYLNYEEIATDDLHTFSVYARIKVLTEAGKDHANVELRYAKWREGAGFTVDSVEGRTIHSDGTVVPFTGKPYEKLIVKDQGLKVMAKVFTLPDVQVGSILEYRYSIRYDDQYFVAPKWYIQGDLFIRNAHFVWKPTHRDMVDSRGEAISTISWFPILPADAKLKESELQQGGFNGPQKVFDLTIQNVPPAPHDEYMPPISSLTYRVLFYYSQYSNGQEFWDKEGKRWDKDRNKFIGPGRGVTAAVQQLVAPSDTQEQKLRKIYGAIMAMENTSYTRAQTTQEDKAHGFKEVRDTDDILARKSGYNDQLAELFVAMARAAGMNAYIGAVTNRDKNFFIKGFLTLGQLNDYIAIVNVNGKEQYFDPGSRYCSYGQLEWKHTMAEGIRQTDKGATFFETPAEPYVDSRTQRVGDLVMDVHGAVSGTVKMTYIGEPALTWRQRSLTGDETSLRDDLRSSVKDLLPQGMDVQVASIDYLANYNLPLVVNLVVKGNIGVPTGKRLFVPSDIFESNEKPRFASVSRETPVSFNYPHMVQDAVRIKYPAGFTVESSPANDQIRFKTFALYAVESTPAPGSITFRRNFSLGEIIYLKTEYPGLRDFFSKVLTKDQENIVLTTAAVAPKSTPAAN